MTSTKPAGAKQKKHTSNSKPKSDGAKKKRVSFADQSPAKDGYVSVNNNFQPNFKKKKNKKKKFDKSFKNDQNLKGDSVEGENSQSKPVNEMKKNNKSFKKDKNLKLDGSVEVDNSQSKPVNENKKIKSFNKDKNLKLDDAVDVENSESEVVNKNKSVKRKSEEFDEASPSKKLKLHEMKFKKRKEMRKQKKSENFDVVKHLKKLWEDLRREDCEPVKKEQRLKQISGIIKGRAKEFVFAHDTVRVLETVISEGTEEHRSLLFDELKNDIIPLAKSKYGKFFLMKMLRYGSKKQKEAIINAFQGLVTKLMKHTEAAEVVETAFNECANALQRFQMIQEFYGSSYRFFKESNIHNLKELLEKKPENKTSVINSMKEELLKVLDKSVIKHSFIHHILLQFFLNCDAASRSEIIQSLKEVIPEILHTKDGSKVAMHCVWHGTMKDRKAIVKSMKTFVKKIAMEEHGHMVLLALFDCVDDTILIEKIIIKELQDNLLDISQNVHGKKVLIYLLNPRDPHFFHPDIINKLKTGDDNETSKKDPEKRRHELKVAIAQPLTELIVNKIAELYRNNAFCLFTVTILKHTVGDKRAAYETVSKLLFEPLAPENKNVHAIENSGSYFMLKQLILCDTRAQKDGMLNSVSFSEVLVSTVPSGVMKSWFQCNRGAFLLVSLMETEIPAVINKVQEELTGCRTQLNKLNFKGAEILLIKLKSVPV